MDLQLSGKTALVTGSTAGIGHAIAATLLGEGARVIVNGRTQARVEAAIAAFPPGSRDRAIGLAADVSKADGVAQAIERQPDVDILINNMGIFEPKPFAEITDADWFRFFEANVMSGVRLSRHYVPRKSAIQIPAEMIHYGMTKTAQLAISRGLAETTAGTGVTVNSVLPGPTKSEGVMAFVDQLARDQKVDTAVLEKEFFQSARPTSLLRRFETPEEVAAMVAFVASPLSSGTNGAALRVDGGVVRSLV
jgi:NAD(P)-dependent dehydrogenase (short-subunit alcohol dehydrogenase family)